MSPLARAALILLLCACTLRAAPPTKAPGSKKKLAAKKAPVKVKGPLTLAILEARLIKAEKMAKVAKKVAYKARKQTTLLIKKLAILDQLKLTQGKFSDEKPCPVKVLGFYHAPQFQACFHLARASMYLNNTEAEASCQRLHEDAHLVTPDSRSKYEYLKQKWTNSRGIGSVIRYWTSGKQKGRGDWYWNATQTEMTYQNWLPVTSHNNPLFQCVAVLSNEGFFWADVPCGSRHMVTCEIKLEKKKSQKNQVINP